MLNRPGICALLIVAALVSGAARAFADTRPAVVSTQIYVSGTVLSCDVRSSDLLSQRFVGTIDSGLPAVLELIFRVDDGRGNALAEGVHIVEILYDVWEDVYRVTRADSVERYATFAEMREGLERLRRVPLVDANTMTDDGSYTLAVVVAVHPLRGSEQEQMVGWVDEQVLGQSSRGWRERVLNIGDLIHGIFSREGDASTRSEVHRSAVFTRESLRHTEGRTGLRPLELAAAHLRVRRDALTLEASP